MSASHLRDKRCPVLLQDALGFTLGRASVALHCVAVVSSTDLSPLSMVVSTDF